MAQIPLFPLYFADSGSGAALVPASPDPLTVDELVEKTAHGAGELGHATGSVGARELGHATALNLLPAMEDGTEPAAEEPAPLVQSHALPAPTTAPNAAVEQTFPVKKKPPTPKHPNAARKHPRPKAAPPGSSRAASPASPMRPGLPTASQELRAAAAGGDTEQSPTELPWGGRATTSRPVLQISPSTLPPTAPWHLTDSTGDAGSAPTVAPTGDAGNQTSSAETEVHMAEESQETTTSTIITTTVITTEPTPSKLCCLHGDGDGQGFWV